ncbi:MAG: S9 family peptidase [Deltaproteobacteria bacterium]|nr:S9 family peptidase [Deltaproteobacteria bacterium]
MKRFSSPRWFAASIFCIALSNFALMAEEIPFAQLFEPEKQFQQADRLAWSPDGDRLAYRFDDGEGTGLWLLDPQEQTSRLLVRTVESDGEGSTDGLEEITTPRWSPDGKSIVLTDQGDLFLLSVGTAKLRRLTSTEADEEDPKFSPDGKRIAFVRESNLHIYYLRDDRERALTTDGEGDRILNGKTDWVYWEELWGRDSTGFWWSPDGKRIAFYRFDESEVEAYALVNFQPTYPEVTWQKYPKAGQTNPTVRVGVIPAAGGESVWLETGDPQLGYLPRVDWTSKDSLAIQHLNREQNRIDLLSCNARQGDCTNLLTEELTTWVNVEDDYAFLKDGRFIWGSERSGWRHLYLYDAKGTLIRQLTSGKGHVTSLDAVQEDRGKIILTRHREGPLGAKDRRIEAVHLDGSGKKELTSGEGWNGAEVSSSGLWVHTWSDSDHPPVRTVRSPAGEALTSLPRQLSQGPDLNLLPKWEFLTLPGPEGVPLPARLLKPDGFDPAKRYPVVMYHYGGPQSQVVQNSWGGRNRDLWHRWMAHRGYVVLMADNQASNFFGKTGGDRVHRRFGPTNLAAQLAAVEYLKGLSWVDPERIGLWGWSGGGSNTLYALFNSPGTWRAGVSGAPVTNWTLYDSIWTERYLDHPEDNEQGYLLSSSTTHAKHLKDALLIVHGTGDDNVHPQNTFALTKVLIDEGIPFEEAIYPRQKHGFKKAEYRHFLRRMTEFFDRHLGPPGGSSPGEVEAP